VRSALDWLVKMRDPQGTWRSTQATVLSLKALLAGTGKPLGGDGARVVEVRIDGERPPAIEIAAAAAEVMKSVELPRDRLRGDVRLTLTEKTQAGAGYQVSLRYHVRQEKGSDWFAVDLKYDRTEAAVNEAVRATATLRALKDEPAQMVMLELPLPPGFEAAPE